MKLSVTLIFCLLTVSVSAQLTRPKYYEVYLGPGLLTVFSDIGDFNTGYAANAGFRYRLDPHFSLKANLVSGLISGTDEGSRNEGRGIRYNTFLIEPTAQIEFFIFSEKRGFSRRGMMILKPAINPYVYVGAGGIYFNPSVTFPGEEKEAPNFTKFTTVVTGGGGINFVLNKKWSLNIELGGRFITTDYLDGYTSYASKSNDLYYFTTVNAIYRIIPGPRRRR